MEEKNLLRIAIIISLIGVLILIIITEKIDISESNIAQITEKNIDQTVKIKGQITRITKTETIMILNIKDSTGEIKVTAFNPEESNLKTNQIVGINGKVTEYMNQIQIEADKIKIF